MKISNILGNLQKSFIERLTQNKQFAPNFIWFICSTKFAILKNMSQEHCVGDVWVGQDGDGQPVIRIVTAVILPDNSGNDCQIALDGKGPVHVGWWYGQGWSELSQCKACAKGTPTTACLRCLEG